MYHSTQTIDVEIPQKYRDDDLKAVPGTHVFGYKEKELYAYSKDKMAYMEVNLVLIENQVYVGGIRGDYISGRPLPDKMNKYIIDNVFID